MRTSEPKPHLDQKVASVLRFRSSQTRVPRNDANFGIGTLARCGILGGPRQLPPPRVTASTWEFTGRGTADQAGQSLWLDTGEPDHLTPFFRFVGDELAERGGRSRQRHVSEVSETGAQLGIDKPGVDRFVQYIDNLSRGVAGRADPIERGGLIARERL